MNVPDFLRGVDLENYTNSPGHAGWYGVFSPRYSAEEVSREFLRRFCFGRSIVLLSSLWIDADLGYAFDHHGVPDGIQCVIREMLAEGQLASWDTSHFEDYDSEEFARFLGDCDGKFRILNDADELLIGRSVSLLADNFGVHGHLFMADPVAGLLVYPHEEKGFGFISKSGRDSIDCLIEALRNHYGETFGFHVNDGSAHR